MLLAYLTYIVPGSILIPILLFVTKYNKTTPPLKIAAGYLFLSAAANVIAIYLAKHGMSNLLLLHIYTVLETVILLLFFSAIIPSKAVKLIIWFILIIFPVICTANLLLLQPSSKFNSYTRSVESLIFIFLCLFYWLKNDDGSASWVAMPLNWLVSGLLLYFASSFFLFLASNFLLAGVEQGKGFSAWDAVWVIHATLVMIMYLFFAVGFSKSK